MTKKGVGRSSITINNEKKKNKSSISGPFYHNPFSIHTIIGILR
jgi:hypothetical protein